MKDGHKREILYGVHPVMAALAAGRRTVYAIYVTGSERNKKHPDPVRGRAAEIGVPVIVTSGDQLKRMTGSDAHQGVAAEVGRYPLSALDDVPAIKAVSGDTFLLIADGILDPHNLGALIRTGACAGVDAVIIPGDNAASPTPAVSKASAGTMESMRIVRETNIARTIDRLKESGIWVAGLDRSGGVSLYDADLTGPMALVIGGEDRGVRRLVREKCDWIVAIPQKDDVNSLNASVAGGIAMYEIVRQRRNK
ncbi:MAG: 23S rRNA (guanosine(2251)-2'-O)-methyltransferase RlmB [Thermodesulfobacteriota bacterium]